MHKYSQLDFNELYKPVLNSFGRLAQEQTEAINRTMGDWAEQLAKHFREQMNQVYQAMGASFQEMLGRAEVDAYQVAPLLKRANFWLSPSTSYLLSKLKSIAESDDATPERVVSAFIEYYEQDEWNNLKKMVSSWENNPYFASRKHIIADALDAHLAGKYTLVIPTLLSQVEGIASSVLGRPAGKTTDLVRSAIKDQQGEFLHAASKDILIEFITGPMGYASIGQKDFTPEKFPEWLESKGISETQCINRHGILHGVYTNYDSKENSLRVFLLLDVLHEMKRDEWDLEWKVLLHGSKSESGT